MEWPGAKRSNDTIEIYDVAGQKVRHMRMYQTQRAELSVVDLAPGIYYVTVQHAHGRAQCKVVVE